MYVPLGVTEEGGGFWNPKWFSNANVAFFVGGGGGVLYFSGNNKANHTLAVGKPPPSLSLF
jgi:hypothetical protein